MGVWLGMLGFRERGESISLSGVKTLEGSGQVAEWIGIRGDGGPCRGQGTGA